MITEKCFKEVMNNLTEIYENAPSGRALQMYYIVFNNKFESDNEFKQATYKLIETRVFPKFPKPAEFFEANNKKDDIETETIKIAEQIKTAIRKYGAYENVCFDNPAIHKIIQNLFGSWVKACKMNSEEFNNIIKWELPKVVKMYKNEKLKSVPIFLEGIATNQNDNKGVKQEIKINYIGDKNKCLQWNKSYANKNEFCIENQDKYIKLGIETKQIEYQESSNVEEGKRIIEELKCEEVKKEHARVEYTQEQLLKMLK